MDPIPVLIEKLARLSDKDLERSATSLSQDPLREASPSEAARGKARGGGDMGTEYRRRRATQHRAVAAGRSQDGDLGQARPASPGERSATVPG